MQPTWNQRYARFTELLGKSSELIPNGTIMPRWIGSSTRFWYERHGASGLTYRVMDAGTGTVLYEVSVAAVLTALEACIGVSIDKQQLLLKNVRFDAALNYLHFEAHQESWKYHIGCAEVTPEFKRSDTTWLASPDGDALVLVKGNNLVLRKTSDGAETALTTGGEHTFAYGSPPAAARNMHRKDVEEKPHGIWSPDSRWFFSLQTDDRQVGALPLVNHLSGSRPEVVQNFTSLPMDEHVTQFRMLAIDVVSGEQVFADHASQPAVRMNSTPFSGGMAWWASDSNTAYFVDIARGEKTAQIIAFDVATGATRVVFTETSDAALELGVNVYTPALIFPLPESSEVIWYSERSGHGHLYLVDLQTGSIKRQLTEGAWQVREVLAVDNKRREVFFMAGGLNAAGDPYLRRPCIASLDHSELRILSDEPGDHIVWRPNEFGLLGLVFSGADPAAVSGLSPDGEYFVETVGNVDAVPATSLRRRDGSLVCTLEMGDAEQLPADWAWPEAVETVAADGKTRVFGLLFAPWRPDPERKVPLIDFVYGGPQISFVPKSAGTEGMMGGSYVEAAALTSLGCYVLMIDGRGTACRERAFRQASYGAVHTASNLSDHIAGIRQLAARDARIDTERVGITGFSGGGYLTALAALQHGDFFTVAVAGGGNYDQAMFWHCWGERYHGAYDAEHYRVQAAKSYASGLSGKLLLVHGLMDAGCHPSALFQLTQALIEENKEFDQVLMPKAGHQWTGYGQRRRIDYFTRHLLGATPPQLPAFKESFELALERLANTEIPLATIRQEAPVAPKAI